MGHYTVTLTIKDKDLDKRNWAPEEVCDRLKKWTECGITSGKDPDVDPIQVHNYTLEVERVEVEPMQNDIAQIEEFLLEVVCGRHIFHDAVEIEDLPRKTIPAESFHDSGIIYEGTRPYLMVISPSETDFNEGILPSYHYVFGVPYYWEIPNATEKQMEIFGGITSCYGWTDLYGNLHNNVWKGPESAWEDTVIGFFHITEDILPYIKSEKYPGPWED